MGKMMQAVRRAVGADREAPAASAAAPPTVDRRAEYAAAAAGFVAAMRRGDQAAASSWHASLHMIRTQAQHEGHAQPMAAVWIDPPLFADAAGVDWYAAMLAHLLDDAPRPAPRMSFNQQEWGYWAQRYSAACSALVAAYRSRDPHAVGVAECEFGSLYGDACRAGQFFAGSGRFMPLPSAAVQGDEAALAAWEAEAAFRLERAQPSGRYQEPSLAFLSPAGWKHSAIRLLTDWQGHVAGTSIIGDAEQSHRLVRDGIAAWQDEGNIPADPNPPRPKPTDPRAGWQTVRFVRDGTLTNGQRKQAGLSVRVPLDEAEMLTRLGIAEYPPPPLTALPATPTVFGSP